MKQMNHSPLPWKMDCCTGAPRISDAEGEVISILTPEEDSDIGIITRKNITFIIHACNNFEPLLKAAKDFSTTQRELAICAERKGVICLSCEGRDRCSLRDRYFGTRDELEKVIEEEGEKDEKSSGA